MKKKEKTMTTDQKYGKHNENDEKQIQNNEN